MAIRTAFCMHKLDFSIKARTSRGPISTHKVWILKLWKEDLPACFGLGEAAPLPGLSLENEVTVKKDCALLAHRLAQLTNPEEALELQSWRRGLCASVSAAAEMALLDLSNGGKRCLLPQNSFYRGQGIAINGLIWMGNIDYMWQQIEEKVAMNFKCLKIKVGGLDFKEECALLSRIRKKYGKKLILRLDANGAFSEEEAADRLERLSRYDIHSIEQPVSVRAQATSATLCRSGAIDVALDEQLIGCSVEEEGDALLDSIQPQYIVLKPSLLGGYLPCRRWIEKAEARKIKWWISSALESNIGLNAIAQLSASLPGQRIEGLGTGQIYANNIFSPLIIKNGALFYRSDHNWSLKDLNFQHI